MHKRAAVAVADQQRLRAGQQHGAGGEVRQPRPHRRTDALPDDLALQSRLTHTQRERERERERERACE
eukprot:COSAG03_NODE_5834_length_1165_cov_1.874296_3_plen_67_part_01